MTDTQHLPTITEIMAEPLAEGADLDEAILGDGAGGEGVEYLQGDVTGEIAYTKIRGWWILRHGTDAGGDWTYTYSPHATYHEATAAYIEAIEAAQAQGVTWEPDHCPIWDRVAAAW